MSQDCILLIQKQYSGWVFYIFVTRDLFYVLSIVKITTLVSK